MVTVLPLSDWLCRQTGTLLLKPYQSLTQISCSSLHADKGLTFICQAPYVDRQIRRLAHYEVHNLN